MWERNLDTGKWSEQIDQLPKDYYDGIKQDIQTVRLYSKCLSGSVYMMIDDFDNIYNTLDVDKIGYYVKSNFSLINLPQRGSQIEINSSNYEEFYQRYLREYAFTIKNLSNLNQIT
jgi:Mg2+/Co2+ transporter CorC